MKNKLNKIISSLLILAFLISAFTVFAFANEGEDSADLTDENIEVLLNRSFDEGWEFDNGLKDASGNNNFFVDYEEDSEYNYNYFFRLETLNETNSYAEFEFQTDAARDGATILELSFKLDDYADIGAIVTAMTEVKGQTITLFAINAGKLIAFPNQKPTEICVLDNDWTDVAMIFDWNKADFTCTLIYTDKLGEEKEQLITFKYDKEEDKGLKWIRFGFPKITGGTDTAKQRVGMNYCIDNLKIYNSTLSELGHIAKDNYGKKLTTSKDKTVDIQAGGGKKSTAQLLREALCMKVGVDYALVKDTKQPIFENTETGVLYGAPEVKNGQVMIPLQLLLDYIDFPYYLHPDGISFDITTGTSVTYITVGRDTAKVDKDRVELNAAPGYVKDADGNSYLAISLLDIETLFPGWLVTYDDMGLIIIYEDTTPEDKEDNADLLTREGGLDKMVELMKKFIFETVDAEKANDAYLATGNKVYEDTKKNTDNFSHPYIYVNQTRFDEIKTAYEADTDESFTDRVTQLINSANASMQKYADGAVGTYEGLKLIPVNPYSDGKNPDPDNPDDTTVKDTTDGYDPEGGRLNIIGTYTSFLPNIAFAYQVTGNRAYADFAYDWMVELVKWDHWGPGHFLNAAEAAASFSVAYDWLYNAFVEYGYDTAVLAQGLYDLAVYDGYVSSSGKPCEHPRNAGDGSVYNTANSNWNAVCTAGMVMASLAIFDYVDADMAGEMFSNTTYLVGNNMKNLATYGLDEYAPDGSYIESASYWAYGTNFFFRFVAALDSAAGTDYGFMDTWGIDKTCYYACQIVSSDGKMWNYHDGGADGVTSGNLGTVDSSMFNFVAKFTGDSALASLRSEHLARRYANVTLYDILYYPSAADLEDKVELPLDYHMQGIDAFVARDSWESGALYTGLMGGANNANHGQLDSGNFIYHNKGVVWFMDLGSENYNVYGYFGSQRNKYYRCNAEGQNVILTTSNQTDIAYGQHSSGSGKIIQTGTNEHGSYAILDNSSAYIDTVFHARRGILVTNDRNTVVIQDEISVVKTETYYWVAHTAQEIVEISEDGKTAYLKAKGADGKNYFLRATIVAQRKGLVFDALDTTPKNFLLDVTADPSYSTNNGGVAEYGRDNIQKLAIRCPDTSLFEIAVVFELVESVGSSAPVGYEWESMFNWEPAAPKEEGTESAVREEAKKETINSNNMMAKKLIQNGDGFSVSVEQLYAALTEIAYTFKTFDVMKDPALAQPYIEYEEYSEIYEDYVEYLEDSFGTTVDIAESMMGFKKAPANEEPAE